MKEIICINIGQSGVQLSSAIWELFCIEHGINANGLVRENYDIKDSQSFQTFFQEAPTGQYVPRAINIDLESVVVDEIRSGPYRNLFHPDQLISGDEDGASNYARGFFTIGKNLMDNFAAVLRKLVDACNSLQGFFISHSISGGTGSGFTALVLDLLTLEYTKKNRFQICIYPNPEMSTAIVEPYNCVLSSVKTNDSVDLTAVMDNTAIFKLCNTNVQIVRPTYNNLNRVISQVFSDMTVCLRFQNHLNADLDNMCTNLIPYPAIHFPVVSHTPLMSSVKSEHDFSDTLLLTKSLFDSTHQMVTCDLKEGKYMCCVIQYRGDVTPKDVNQSLSAIKRMQDIRFVEWCPTGFKVGLNAQPPTRVPGSELAPTSRSVTMLANTTSIKELFSRICKKFDILFSKRSFVHWYVGEGMEEGEFNEARDNFASIQNDFDEMEVEENEEDEEEPPVVNDAPPTQVKSSDDEAPPDDEGPRDDGESAADAGGGADDEPGAPEVVESGTAASEAEETEEEEEDDDDDADEDEDEDEDEDLSQ